MKFSCIQIFVLLISINLNAQIFNDLESSPNNNLESNEIKEIFKNQDILKLKSKCTEAVSNDVDQLFDLIDSLKSVFKSEIYTGLEFYNYKEKEENIIRITFNDSYNLSNQINLYVYYKEGASPYIYYMHLTTPSSQQYYPQLVNSILPKAMRIQTNPNLKEAIDESLVILKLFEEADDMGTMIIERERSTYSNILSSLVWRYLCLGNLESSNKYADLFKAFNELTYLKNISVLILYILTDQEDKLMPLIDHYSKLNENQKTNTLKSFDFKTKQLKYNNINVEKLELYRAKLEKF